MFLWNIDTTEIEKYVPERRQGGTMANQTATAVYRLVYGWYRNGDVFDNTYCSTFTFEGCGNDLSNEANWLYRYADGAAFILEDIKECRDSSDYEMLIKKLVALVGSEEYLDKYSGKARCDDIYDCKRPYHFVRPDSRFKEDEIDELFGKVKIDEAGNLSYDEFHDLWMKRNSDSRFKRTPVILH